MKKHITTSLLLLLSMICFAQEAETPKDSTHTKKVKFKKFRKLKCCKIENDIINFQNKNGFTMLPEKGDYSIQAEIGPILNFTKGIFFYDGSNFSETYPMFSSGLTFKHFKSDSKAFVFGTQLSFGEQVITNQVPMNGNTSESVTDKLKTNSSNINLSFGIEHRRGNTRVQGTFEKYLALNYDESLLEYTYGNAMTATIGSPYSTIFYNGSTYTTNSSSRIVNNHNYSDISIQGGINIGVEYFIAPKLSLSGKIGAYAAYGINGKSKTKIESSSYNGSYYEIEYETTTTEGSRFFNIVQLNNSLVALAFYF